MDRKTERVDTSHDRMTLTMQSTSERDHWMRTFPNPMPDTHQLGYRWEGNDLMIGPELKPELELDEEPEPEPAKAKDSKPGPGKKPAPAKSVGDVHKDARAALLVELESKYKTDEDLATFAAENGVELPANMTRAMKLAKLTEKLVTVKSK